MLGNDSGLGSVVGLRQGEQAAQTVKSISDVTFSKYSGLSTTLMPVEYGPEALFDEDLSTVGENVLILLQRPTAPGMVSETDYHLYKTIETRVSTGVPVADTRGEQVLPFPLAIEDQYGLYLDAVMFFR